jgi:hypothetical protein
MTDANTASVIAMKNNNLTCSHYGIDDTNQFLESVNDVVIRISLHIRSKFYHSSFSSAS